MPNSLVDTDIKNNQNLIYCIYAKIIPRKRKNSGKVRCVRDAKSTKIIFIITRHRQINRLFMKIYTKHFCVVICDACCLFGCSTIVGALK